MLLSENTYFCNYRQIERGKQAEAEENVVKQLTNGSQTVDKRWQSDSRAIAQQLHSSCTAIVKTIRQRYWIKISSFSVIPSCNSDGIQRLDVGLSLEYFRP